MILLGSMTDGYYSEDGRWSVRAASTRVRKGQAPGYLIYEWGHVVKRARTLAEVREYVNGRETDKPLQST